MIAFAELEDIVGTFLPVKGMPKNLMHCVGINRKSFATRELYRLGSLIITICQPYN